MHNIHKSKRNYRLLFFRFRESVYYPIVFYGTIIVFCLILIVTVVIPLIGNVFSVNAGVTATRAQIAMLTQNIAYLTSLQNSDLSQSVSLADALVPQNKNFGAAIQAVDATAQTTNVSITNVSFKSEGVSTKTTAIPLSVSVQGNEQSLTQFLVSLATKVPLMNIQTVSLSQSTATLTIDVAYEPYVQKAVDLTQASVALSPATVSLLQKAVQWQQASLFSFGPSASGSATASLPPF